MNEDIRFHIPQGFKLNYKSKDFFTIEYERTEMIAMIFSWGFGYGSAPVDVWFFYL